MSEEICSNAVPSKYFVQYGHGYQLTIHLMLMFFLSIVVSEMLTAVVQMSFKADSTIEGVSVRSVKSVTMFNLTLVISTWVIVNISISFARALVTTTVCFTLA